MEIPQSYRLNATPSCLSQSTHLNNPDSNCSTKIRVLSKFVAFRRQTKTLLFNASFDDERTRLYQLQLQTRDITILHCTMRTTAFFAQCHFNLQMILITNIGQCGKL